jgi:hypothetical protein
MSLGMGCAEERDPINRVQANALDKTFFVGANLVDAADDPEFRHRSYVVDGSASQSLIGIGEWGHVDRVRWEITADLLIARKAYELAPAQDNKGSVSGDPTNTTGAAPSDKFLQKTNNGTIVAAYKIQSHFDIKRSYNPQTGEENNIVEENTQDRPWNERQFMRVDWSQNMVNDPMAINFIGNAFGQTTVTPISYYVSDTSNPDAPVIDEKAGYMDITNKFTVAPEMTDLGGFSLPTCALVGIYTGSATYDCNAQEATVRNSWAKIQPDEDFEPLENTFASQDIVGNPGGQGSSLNVGVINAPRQGWDPQYGFTDSLLHRYANIHNTWKKSHVDVACTSNADANGDGTADACAGAAGVTMGGSQCDMALAKCTIPLRQREIKTFGYWVNKEAPNDLLDPVGDDGKPTGRGTLEDLIYSWNQLISVAVATSREVECRRTKEGTRETCHAKFFSSTRKDPGSMEMLSYGGWLVEKPSDPTPTVTFCHNPVRSYDLEGTCGKKDSIARVGDVRKNFIYYWPFESRAPWGGIADWNGDPLTGEIWGGAAQIMGRSATYAAALQRDVLQLAMGDVKIEDLVQGVQAQQYVKTLQNGFAPTTLSDKQLQDKVSGLDLSTLRAQGPQLAAGLSQEDRLKALLLDKQNLVADGLKVQGAQGEFDTLAKKIQATPYESQLVDGSWANAVLGSSPKAQSISSSLLDAASPLRNADPGRMELYNQLVTESLHARGACFLENEAPATYSVHLASLKGYFLKKYGGLSKEERGKAIYADLWKEAVKGIGLHEIGHSLGMFHNFASSWDAVNYTPQYWQLRTNNGKSTLKCATARADGSADSCMGPRYLDPETAEEQGTAGESRPGIEYFANTSTMEYQIERFGETVGLGTYDQHAMKALYGRVLETFDTSSVSASAQKQFKYLGFSQLIERPIVGVSFAHYTTAANQMKVFDAKRDCRAATAEELSTAKWRVINGQVCAPPPKDHWRWADFKSDEVQTGLSSPYWHVVDADKVERVRWHYRFGQSNAYMHTGPSDSGADVYEATRNTIRRFDMSYPWAYFRRTSREFLWESIPGAVSNNYFRKLRATHWQVANDLMSSTAADMTSDDGLRPYAVTQNDLFDFFARVITMPEPGDYAESAVHTPPGSPLKIFDLASGGGAMTVPAFSIGIVDGRYVSEQFNNNLGGSWDYQSFMDHAGFSAEKIYALLALVDGRPTLSTISRENALDGRNVRINFRSDLPQATDRLLGGLLAEDWASVAPHIVGSGVQTPQAFSMTAATPQRPLGAQVIFPNVGYKTQLGTVIYSLLFSRLNTDMTLANKTRLWIDGQVGQVTVPTTQQVRFTDPVSGYTYIASKFGDDPGLSGFGQAVDSGIASRMLAHANALLAVAYQTTGKVNEFGQPELAGTKPTLAGDPDTAAVNAQTLRQYIGVLDATRQVGNALGYGPLGGASAE